jgi:predicted RNase H-like nuclease
MYGFVGELGQELTERINLRNKVQKERAELEVVSYLISKPPKTKESVNKKKLEKSKKSVLEEEYIDEGWSRFEG